MAMRTKGLRINVLVAGLLVAVTAGAGHAAENKRADPAQLARGAKEWVAQCSRCHNLRNPKEMKDSDWSLVVSHMRVRANIPGQMARDIEAFLRKAN
jgi:mono/diheme cytochrome c family protein